MIRESLQLLLDVFSRRHSGRKYLPDEVPAAVRNRILLLCRDLFSGRWQELSSGHNYTYEFWEEIHRSLQIAHGVLQLCPDTRSSTPVEDLLVFLPSCKPEHFLDFVELLFKTSCLHRVVRDESQVVDAVNDIFRSERVPFQLTPMVKEEESRVTPFHPYGGGRVIRTVAYPQVIRADDELTHSEALVPVLSVLAEPAFTSANQELRGALEDYRRSGFGDCLTKCGSAFESALKVICSKRGWNYNQTDTASALLSTIIPKTNLESFFQQQLLLVATMRNRLSTAHGAGTSAREVPRHIAQFAITSTASAIILLVHETS